MQCSGVLRFTCTCRSMEENDHTGVQLTATCPISLHKQCKTVTGRHSSFFSLSPSHTVYKDMSVSQQHYCRPFHIITWHIHMKSSESLPASWKDTQREVSFWEQETLKTSTFSIGSCEMMNLVLKVFNQLFKPHWKWSLPYYLLMFYATIN